MRTLVKARAEKPESKLIITGNRDSMLALKRIIENIQAHGAPGHSFEVYAGDGPRSQLPEKGGKIYAEKHLGGWDGDGSDRVVEMTLENIVESDSKKGVKS